MTTKSDDKGEKHFSIRTLHADPDNPRQISGAALAGLSTSMEKFGDLSGIVYNDRTGELVAGHQRLKNLRRAGAKDWVRASPTEGYIEDPRSKERFKIRIVDWDETTQRAANLVANSPEIAGEYTEEAIDQIAALEQELVEFDALAMRELEATLRKQFKMTTGGEGAGGEDESGQITNTFTIIIECTDESQQLALLDKFTGEGLSCRALT